MPGDDPLTKPLAGRVGARIVGTIGGTAHRPPIMSVLSGVAHNTNVDTHFCILSGDSP